MGVVFYFLLAALIIRKELSGAVLDENQCSKFDYEYKILERIIFLENKNKELEKDQMVLGRKNEELVEIVRSREQRLEMERVVKELEQEMKKTDLNLEAEVQNLTATQESRLIQVSSDMDQIKKKLGDENAILKQLGIEIVQKDKAQTEARKLLKSELEVEDRRLKTAIQGLGANMTAKIEKIKTELVTTKTNRVGFSARRANYLRDSSAKIVVFDKVVTDVSNAYNATTGIFTAPVEGLYLFSATLRTYNRYTELSIYKNSNVVGKMYADGYRGGATNDQSTNTVVVELQKDDEVYVKLHHSGGSGNSVVLGSDSSSFSGVFVQ